MTGYRQINLTIPVALYGDTPAKQEAELEWLKKAILMFVSDHPDEMMDRVTLESVDVLTEEQFESITGDEPVLGYSEAVKQQHWANDPRGL